jgi:hypothetical protein
MVRYQGWISLSKEINMARLPLLNSDADQWGALLNEFLLVSHHEDGTPADYVNTIADLRALSPGVLPCLTLLGYHAPGDGGGGLFCWDATSTDPDNGGTVIMPTGNPPQGRWKRIFSSAISVKWFGAKGDSANDDTSALQAAFDYAANQSPAAYYPPGTDFLATVPSVHFPAGAYRITATLWVQGYMTVDGDKNAEILAHTAGGANDYSFPLLAVNPQGLQITNLAFANGQNHIQIFGTRPGQGSWGNPKAGDLFVIRGCNFRAPKRSAIIMHASSVLAHDGRKMGALQLRVENCVFMGTRFFTGSFDYTTFSGCRIFFMPNLSQTLTGEAGPDHNELACINGGGLIWLRNCIFGGPRDYGGRAAFVRASYGVQVDNCNQGDITTTFLRFVLPSTQDGTHEEDFLTEDVRPALSINGLNISSSPYWLEILSAFPSKLDIQNIDFGLADTSGIFLRDMAAVASGHGIIRTNGSLFTRGLRFHLGTFPQDLDPVNLNLPDVTSRYVAFQSRPDLGEDDVLPNEVARENLMPASIYRDEHLPSSGNGGFVQGATAETETEYSLRILTAASDGAYDIRSLPNWAPPDQQAGVYVFSLYVRTTYDGVIFFSAGPGSVQGPPKVAVNAGAFRRVWFRFYSDGVTPQNLGIAFYNIPKGRTLSYGLFAIHKGTIPALYLFPGNPVPRSIVRQITYLTDQPALGIGTWKVGDIVYNTNPLPGGSIGWVYTAAGWRAFGAISM